MTPVEYAKTDTHRIVGEERYMIVDSYTLELVRNCIPGRNTFTKEEAVQIMKAQCRMRVMAVKLDCIVGHSLRDES